MERTIRITQEVIDGYGRVNGDHDTNHYDDSYAKGQGYRGAIAHGLLLSGFAIGLAMQRYGADFCRRGEFEHKYLKGTCPGDEFTLALDDDGQVSGTVAGAELTLVGYTRLRDA
ncbi:MaoC family dehydratase [Pigmentiphaga soli]|uniref:MaoC family dehydratase n=1 Tax=Pigmentiphaga soli TaxID=1007095 RepID=A0ABP8HN49_9BURK